MNTEIVNKVANSGLITINLSDYAIKNPISTFDIKDFLFEGVILKEKEFRSSLKNFNFSKYTKKVVAIYCSSNVIIPMWAYMLVASCLAPVCSQIYYGEKKDVFQKILLQNIHKINPHQFKDKKVIVNGCGKVPLSESLFIAITQKLQSSVSSLMFGEACSSVPIYKKKKK